MTGDPVREWHLPLSQSDTVLEAAYRTLDSFALNQHDIPFLIQLIENPKYDLPGIDLFPGGTDLFVHDLIHLLLGRGLLAKDEAFVLGFTMGSTNRMGASEEALYTFCARNLFPKAYRFSDDDVHVFRDAVRLGFVSDCQPLGQVNYDELLPLTLGQARARLGLETKLLRAYYEIEQRRYPDCPESQRLLD